MLQMLNVLQFFLIFVMVSCGEPNVAKRVQDDAPHIAPLPWNSGQTLELSGKDVRSFSGSLVFWNPEVSVEAMQNVENTTGEERHILSLWLEEVNTHQPEVAKKNLVSLQEDILFWNETLAQELEASRAKIALKWIDDLFAGLATNQQSQAKETWQIYCEAKLWQRALDDRLVLGSYTRRPTPAILCEGSYREKGLFVSADGQPTPACADASEGKSYFECLWRDGVLRTTIAEKRYPQESEAGQILRRISNETLVDNLVWYPRLQSLLLKHAGARFYQTEAREQVVAEVPRVSGVEVPQFETTSAYSIVYNIENQRATLAPDLQPKIYDTIRALQMTGAFSSVSEVLFNAPYGVGLTPEQRTADPTYWAQTKQTLPKLFSGEAPDIELELSKAKERFAAVLETERIWVEGLEPSQACSSNDTLGCQRAAVLRKKLALTASPDVSLARYVNVGLRVILDDNAQHPTLHWHWNKRDLDGLVFCESDACDGTLSTDSQGYHSVEIDSEALQTKAFALVERKDQEQLEFNELQAFHESGAHVTIAFDLNDFQLAQGASFQFVSLELLAMDRDKGVLHAGHGMLVDDYALEQKAFKELADFVRSYSAE